jgi:hypothetical protein
MIRIGIATLLAVLLQGCAALTTPSSSQAVQQPYQRFVPAAASDRDFALDTKTGKLCKTWRWTVADSALNDLPECVALRDQFPDTAPAPKVIREETR